MFIVGAEDSHLHHQAHVMAMKLAGLHDSDVQFDQHWAKNGIVWRKVLDVQHSSLTLGNRASRGEEAPDYQ
jgi:hypothetical protein